MYDREDNDTIYTFEPSGGLINASLVMQDFETDSYWSIMTNEAVAGKQKGTKLRELPVSIKTQWKDWLIKHPQTLVLSVEGKEDVPGGYTSYFNSSRTFRGITASDDRLDDKEPIFVFELGQTKYAVANKHIEGGKTFRLGNNQIFLFRPEESEIFYSTIAYITENRAILKENNVWVDVENDCIFNEQSAAFFGENGVCPERLNGYDTFWYMYILTNPEAVLLE